MNNITLGIYRRLDNRFEGLPDDSVRGLELHNLRKNALHDVLDNQEVARVIDWGLTDDTNSHEYVELILSVLGTKILEPILIAGVKDVGKKLAEKAIDETTSEFVKWIISKFIKKQKEKKLLDFSINLKDGTSLRVDPPDGTSEITINFKDGTLTSIKYKLE